MDPEVSQGAGMAPQPAVAPPAEAPAVQMTPTTKQTTNDSFSEFGEHSSFNMALALTWMVAVFAVLATLFFWWMNKNESEALADKKTEKDSLTQQISAPGSVDIERKAQDFKSSVSALKTAYSGKYSYSDFLNDLNGKLTTDIKLNNISLNSDGKLSLNGSANSYRGVADLMVALKSWSTLSSVNLESVARATVDKNETIFSISAKVDMQKQKDIANSGATSTTGSTATGGGANAAVQ